MSKTPLLVITRPQEDAETLAALLGERGCQSLCEPMLSIEHIKVEKDTLDAVRGIPPKAIIITSKHAIAAFAEMTDERSIPIIAAGKMTAEHAQRLGFTQVMLGGGTAHAVIQYIKAHFEPRDGVFLYLRGKHVSTDMAMALSRHSFKTVSLVVYDSKKAERLSAHLTDALKEHAVSAILFFSLRTASHYAHLAQQFGLTELHGEVSAICMSKRIAESLHAAGFGKILTASLPDMPGMLALIDRHFATVA